jgi:hypothetical protein
MKTATITRILFLIHAFPFLNIIFIALHTAPLTLVRFSKAFMLLKYFIITGLTSMKRFILVSHFIRMFFGRAFGFFHVPFLVMQKIVLFIALTQEVIFNFTFLHRSIVVPVIFLLNFIVFKVWLSFSLFAFITNKQWPSYWKLSFAK